VPVTPFIPILLYHAALGSPGRRHRLEVPLPELRGHLPVLRAPGRSPVALAAIANAVRGTGFLPPHAFAVTLDDATLPTFDAAVELVTSGIPVSVFVSTGPIGSAGMLTAPQLVELSRLPLVELGAHAVRHRRLDELAQGQLEAEVADSKAALEAIVQRPVRSFAYPHGAYDRRVREAVVAAGYDHAVGVKNALSHAADDPFALARWTVARETSAGRIAQVLDGVDVPVAWSEERARTRAFRAARRLRRRVRPDTPRRASTRNDTRRFTGS